jgi:hypothetical protein
MDPNRYRKAIAGLLTPVVIYFAARAGLSLSHDDALYVATAVTGVIVYFVPNG